MNELTQLAKLSAIEKKALKKMATLSQQGIKAHVDMCKVWVNDFEEERREELKGLAQPYLKKRMIVMEGVGSGLVHPSLLFATHKAAEVLRSLPLSEQTRLLNDGIPTLRNKEGKIAQDMLHHEAMTPDDVKVAFEFAGGRWTLQSRAEQKQSLLALTTEENAPMASKRGWGSVKENRFHPATIWIKKGLSEDDLEKALAEVRSQKG